MIKCLDFTGLHFEALNYKTMMGTARRFDLGTRLQLGIGFGLFREGGSRGGSGNGSNGDSSGDKSDSNKNGCGGGSNGDCPDNKSGIYESSYSKAPSNSNEHSFGGGYNEGSTDRLNDKDGLNEGGFAILKY
ncbi:hypothetical protein RhiirA4_529213 [Rhizophagus irregularis]|uniref:Uncharacterized protein n=1 Tax=Rhizophagus irregularis TaxID=588596 RepID=A0A2I1FZT0_9GLOM|nr:hypothetical protein RhiirA4_529213 [Rhizophagus irregularis]